MDSVPFAKTRTCKRSPGSKIKILQIRDLFGLPNPFSASVALAPLDYFLLILWVTDRLIWPRTQMQSTSEEGWEPTDTKIQAHLTTLTEGNKQKYTTYVSRVAFPPQKKKRYNERLTLASLGSWNDVSSCLFIASSPWQHWQCHPYYWHFSPPSPYCHPGLLWPASPANVAIYKNSWDSCADRAFLPCHYRFNGRTKSQGVLTIFLWACRKEGESQSTEQPPPAPARCISRAHTMAQLALDAEHVCQAHQQLGPVP